MATIKRVGGYKGMDKALSDVARKFEVKGELRVGFLEDAKYPDGTSVALIAVTNNYGAPSKGIPPRPFFSNMVADKSPDWPAQLGEILTHNGGDGEQALGLMGELIKGQLQDAIVAGAYEPNSPVTDLLKQRFPMGGQTFADVQQARTDVKNGETAPAGKPLVHTGDMQNSVDWEIGE